VVSYLQNLISGGGGERERETYACSRKKERKKEREKEPTNKQTTSNKDYATVKLIDLIN
jgi:hypothetical protein